MRTHPPDRAAGVAPVVEAEVVGPGDDVAAISAAHLQHLAVHVDEVPAATPLVQVVDVLGDHQDLARPFRLEPGQGPVGGVREDVAAGHGAPAHVVELEHPGRIAGVGLGRRHVLDADPRPQPVGVAEGFQSRFLGDAGAGENDDALVAVHAGSWSC